MNRPVKYQVKFSDVQRRPYGYDLLDESGSVVNKGLFRFRYESDCVAAAELSLEIAAAQTTEASS